ncbi:MULTISPECIES: bifunctional methylenetetrahydrofolate dehydrogenase/methenyltetrahydrofolate cyclohydrolase FolD [unclassified Thalassospira]|uniref:bifunctional methylenetetrahydrofolate dehydrogenase/methenyltetrahydrofolate cyclohydrolase FolD n=1 Tax=unclassified Thalassospira TaxID=2648997 RepID=UPI000ED02E43|nr:MULTISPECIES: bifunctional methylenetetrahydrofolate dehydrogenase/methenyltetrahydrofolate cyclohydrolase FolD [unclassified Thalassospira]HAI30887.1 bifunctional methylenetetrahydrofolate dehydrogenase/methenyltetrahydrofolate cyclohydrolase FolD [Thalassospira sp.]|tara:strand:+ start:334 stop:1233 length:900 start_codon:yes stop_codon:yes gene_type:complete
MSDAKIIDGKAFAANLRTDITAEVSKLKSEHGVTPGLAVILVGEDPASQVYVRNKGKQTLECGMNSYEHKLPAETSEEDLLALIAKLNADENVHGILCQLPVPKHINEQAILAAIDPAKDVDGFHVVNAGALATGGEGFAPCTPYGCLMLLKDTLGDLSGKRAVVVGRSNIVGKPMAQLLLKESCTVTIAHSRTRDLPEEVRRADIVVAAVGRPNMIKGDWIAPGATVIDVGINRVEGTEGKMKLVGDVEFETASKVAGAITPVPGGVGPMTIACLLNNTLISACRANGLDVPNLGFDG